MKKTSVALLTIPLAASMLLTACGDDTKPTASASSTASSTATTTSAPTPSASPTATVNTKVDPNIPTAARAHTPAGAEAFTRYFFAQLNIAWSKPKAGLISSLSATTCKTCTNFEREAAKSVLVKKRVIGPSIVLTLVETSDTSNPATFTVLALGYQPKSLVVDATGKTVQALKRETVRSQVTVQWGPTGWRISEIQSVA